MNIDNKTDLGPLPKSPRSHELQRTSLHALQGFLRCTDKFLLRDERIDDAGVDCSLELIIKSSYTNFRCQVQLKGTDSQKTNKDGSISHSIDTYNLNYLLNGPSPLFILYVEPTKDLWFVWARDEAHRLNRINPNWTSQEKITIHFKDRLTPEALNDHISNRILVEGRLDRTIHDSLARATLNEKVTISINLKTLEISESHDVYQLLLKSGTSIVASGFGNKVMDLVGILERNTKSDPRIQLICAYAQYTLGRFQAALGHISEALALPDQLSDDDQQFLLTVKDVCEYQTGRIDMAEYLKRANISASQAKGYRALSYSLETLRYKLISEKDLDQRAYLMKQLRALVDTISKLPAAYESFKLRTRLVLLFAEAAENTKNLLHELTLIQMRKALGIPLTKAFKMRMERAIEFWKGWEQSANVALYDANKLGHPILIGDALLTLVGGKIDVLRHQWLDSQFSKSPFRVRQDVLGALMRHTHQAIKIFKEAGTLEAELRGKMILADLLDLSGHSSDAMKIVVDVLPVAQAMGYASLESGAKDFINGNTLLARLASIISQRF